MGALTFLDFPWLDLNAQTLRDICSDLRPGHRRQLKAQMVKFLSSSCRDSLLAMLLEEDGPGGAGKSATSASLETEEEEVARKKQANTISFPWERLKTKHLQNVLSELSLPECKTREDDVAALRQATKDGVPPRVLSRQKRTGTAIAQKRPAAGTGDARRTRQKTEENNSVSAVRSSRGSSRRTSNIMSTVIATRPSLGPSSDKESTDEASTDSEASRPPRRQNSARQVRRQSNDHDVDMMPVRPEAGPAKHGSRFTHDGSSDQQAMPRPSEAKTWSPRMPDGPPPETSPSLEEAFLGSDEFSEPIVGDFVNSDQVKVLKLLLTEFNKIVQVLKPLVNGATDRQAIEKALRIVLDEDLLPGKEDSVRARNFSKVAWAMVHSPNLAHTINLDQPDMFRESFVKHIIEMSK
ncbi:hypothetical protein BDZ89DRAFT_1076477 [Hymenopellis radicata]|nr:hypothetical protein BDZ89DRAFT_1076477 [Hymenopellis radicata]